MKALNPTTLVIAIILSFFGLIIFCLLNQYSETILETIETKNLTFTEQSSKEFEENLNPEQKPKESERTTTERIIFKDKHLTISDCGNN